METLKKWAPPHQVTFKCPPPGPVIGDLGRSNDVDRRLGPKPRRHHPDPKMENGHGHAQKADMHGLMDSTTP